jgi:CRISPR-associated protein Csd1
VILQRLYELAVRENLLDDPAFEVLPVPYLVLVGEGGEYLGFQNIRGVQTIPSQKKGAPPKEVPDKGRPLKVPRAHGNTASQGFARFFADTLPRVLPLVTDEKDQKKADASRKTFWEQIDRAADESNDPVLRGLQAFGRRLDEFTDRIRADAAREEPALTDRVTFAYRPSGGRTLLEEDGSRRWYADHFAGVSANKQDAGPVGVCQVTGTVGPIPTSHPTKLQGVPGGMSVGVSLISFDKPAFGHYGLDGTENAGIGCPAMDGYLRALDSLLKNALPSNKERGGKSKLVIGGTAFLYWTKDARDVGFISLLDDPADDPLKVLLDSVASGKNAADTLDADPFYLLALSGNSARAVVRGYLETTLPAAKANVAKWFKDLAIADTSKNSAGAVNDKFPLWQLALATAFDSDAVAPDTGERLLTAALTGGAIPDSLLALCLKRLMAEGSEAFRAGRMALIKLVLTRRGIPVSEQLDPTRRTRPTWYGRLLAVFEQIQYAALGPVNANVVDKFYGTFSAAPAMVFARLFANAQNHLKKLRGDEEKGGAFKELNDMLEALTTLLPASPPKQHLPLQDQGRFALGYYHEQAAKSKRIADRIADRERRKAEKATKVEAK